LAVVQCARRQGAFWLFITDSQGTVNLEKMAVLPLALLPLVLIFAKRGLPLANRGARCTLCLLHT
jgi:hypothetical protein